MPGKSIPSRRRPSRAPGAACAAALSLATAAAGALGCSRNSPSKMPTPAASEDRNSSRMPEELRTHFARADDYVVRVVAGSVTCSGTLIDDDLVLTAHHCVSQRDQYDDFVKEDVPTEKLSVELGGDYFAWGEVGVRDIVAPPCGHAAGHGDIAILVLERKLIGMPTLAPRLDEAPREGEGIDPVGFGRCAMTHDGVRRRVREGGKIDVVRSSRFSADASICPGDSGGPVVADGEVIGVISQSVMDGSAETRGRSEFTRLDHWRPVFANARAIADGTSPAELPPVECAP